MDGVVESWATVSGQKGTALRSAFSTVLVVDDDPSVQRALNISLNHKFRVLTAGDGASAMRVVARETPDIVLLDIRLPDMGGIDLLKQIKALSPEVITIMITGVDTVKTIVEAVKVGAYDYLVKPIDVSQLFLAIEGSIEKQQLKSKLHALQRTNIERFKLEFIGKSPHVREAIDLARKLAASPDTPVLIVGESGSGKGMLARAIHYNTDPDPGPFITVGCGAIAKDLIESELFGYSPGAFTGAREKGRKGLFEESSGGTLFLDEIGTMPYAAQAKLLGVLEDRIFRRVGGSREIPVTSRIMAASNIDFQEAVDGGLFRRDLYYRLNVVRIEIPPLRERPEDILALSEFFLAKYNRKFKKRFRKISIEAQQQMLAYPWPGNIRELRNILERVMILEDDEILRPVHLRLGSHLNRPPQSGAASPAARPTFEYDEATRRLIQNALAATNGNITAAAALMKMPTHKLRYRIKRLALQDAKGPTAKRPKG